jgi:hypothetical protein
LFGEDNVNSAANAFDDPSPLERIGQERVAGVAAV